jgi:SAM-dependent methyltransferase
MTHRALAASRWDDEYRRGRYTAEPPVAFVDTIQRTLRAHGVSASDPGLYVGCGNGRNYLPLVDAGLTLYGLDVSPQALRSLAERRPAVAPFLIGADFLEFAPDRRFRYVVAIQVFQHGDGADAMRYFRQVAALLVPAGLFFLRVNSVATEIWHPHSVVERSEGGGFTVRYHEGPKRDLLVHFYAREELELLARAAFEAIGEPREDLVRRAAPRTGSWVQWEMVWRRRGRPEDLVREDR